MKTRAETEFDLWVGQNVHTIPGLEDLEGEVERLRAKLEIDLAALVPEIEAELGDLDDLLSSAYESIHDPELGFRDARDG